MKKKALLIIAFLFLIVIDQFFKIISVQQGAVLNTGVSFGLLSGFGGYIFIQLIFLLILLIVLYKAQLALGLKIIFLAGIMSNTADRFLYGGVRDWLEIPFLSIKNNLADWYIFVAILGFVLQYIYEYRNTVRR
jgi:lipoprotein signal peptidase